MKETTSNHSTPKNRPVRDTFLVFGAPALSEQAIQEVVATLRSGWIGTGPRTHEFERCFREYIGAAHAVALSSCTAALELALEVIGVGAGSEVITTPMTFVATANVIVHRGARPVFVDIERETFNIDPARIEAAITPRTRAIIPVHVAGRPCRMDDIMDIARRHNLVVIEDAAHAIEAVYSGRKIGAIGDMAAFSFYPTKNLTTAEGGMLTTSVEEWAERVRLLSLHGLDRDAWKRYSAEGFVQYEATCAGHKFNMTDVQAAMGLPQLARLEDNLVIRERHWHHYNEGLAGLPGISTPLEETGIRHARHLYTLLVDPSSGLTRNELAAALKADNIGTGIHFIAVHLHQFYRQTFGCKRGDYPEAEHVSDRTLSLPLSPALTDEDVDDVICAVRRALAQ